MFLKPIQDGFGDFHFIKPVTHIPHDETWHSYTLPKEDPKNICIIYHVTHSLSSADISIFSPEIRNFFYILKCR